MNEQKHHEVAVLFAIAAFVLLLIGLIANDKMTPEPTKVDIAHSCITTGHIVVDGYKFSCQLEQSTQKSN